jgi:hypothetical protein
MLRQWMMGDPAKERGKKERKRKEQILNTKTSAIEVEERLDCLLCI